MEAGRVRGRHNQIDAGPIPRTNRSVQIDVFANELGGHLRPDAPRAQHAATGSSGQNALHRQTSPATGGHARQPRAAPAGPRGERRFFKSMLSREITFGMKRTRHQLAPAMAGQKIVDRAVAGCMTNGRLIGPLERMDVQHLAAWQTVAARPSPLPASCSPADARPSASA